MKSSKSLKDLKKETHKFKKMSKSFSKSINLLSANIKEEYQQLLELNMLKLIEKISTGENLDKEILINKYLNKEKETDIESTKKNDKTVYDKIDIDGITYYKMEGTSGCSILNDKGKVCGKFEDGKYLFNK